MASLETTMTSDGTGESGVYAFPASFAQRRLWFLDQIEPGRPAYNIPVAVRISGPLDAAGLARALREVVRRHETLRTTFVVSGGEPLQAVAPGLELILPLVDLRGAAGAVAEARELSHREARRPFDLARGPLLRACLLRLADEEHCLVLVLHHIVSDGWSMGVLVREVAVLYDAFSKGRPSPLPELPIQYVDFAVWQREWIEEDPEGQLDYWKRRLEGAPEVLELPGDRPRSAYRTGRGGSLEVRLARALAEGVQALARREGWTPFMVLLAAFQALLGRLSGQADLIVGTPIANRHRPEVQDLIGLFVNTLALRANLSGELTFRELLGRVRETAVGAYTRQDLPFERLVEELAPERSLAHAPLVQVLFALQTDTVPPSALPGLELCVEEVDTGEAKLDLLLALEETAEGLTGRCSYAADLFDAVTVVRMLVHFESLLTGAVVAPQARLSELPLLTAAERRQVTVEWQGGPLPGGEGERLHDQFESQAVRTPEAEALLWEEGSLTYAELERRANRLARHLARSGVGPETLVGVCLERSPEMVVALLAVLKAGGAYVPLDPRHPMQRLAHLLEETDAAVVLSQEGLRERLPAGAAEAVWLPPGGELPEERPERLESGVAVENLAYVIYTSGSTGRPKGVAIEHRSAVALLRWAGEAFSKADLEGVLASTSIGFDLSVFELWAPLSRGGRVVLAANALELPRSRHAGRVTLVNTVPSVMAELVRTDGLPASVRTVNLAGEPLPRELARQIQGLPQDVRLLNLYGPSEDTTYSTAEAVEEESGAPAIGRPLPGTRVHLLDRWASPVPVGVAGEIWIGGAGLARGYLRHPELTAERFLPDPFGAAGERLYRTGDLGRYRRDGRIDFLGRVDHQIKLRGFRVELGEVEASLLSHSRVREAVAVASGQRLVAYVGADGVEAEGLLDQARQWLPEHMVPSAVVVLDALPRTPNGKVDRKALPEPEWSDTTQARVLPRTPAEELLVGIFREVLGVGEVGVHDGFFRLGGHSLLATQVVSRMREAFGVEVALRSLFESPTVAGLAARVATRLREGTSRQAPPIVPGPLAGELPLSFAQERLWFLDQLDGDGAAYNIHGALWLTGALDAAALEKSLRRVVHRHEALRTTFASRRGRPMQVVAPPGLWELPRIDLSGVAGSVVELRFLAEEEARRAFDLARGPLFRAALVRLSTAEHALLVNMHHAVSDGWSLGVLMREMSDLYRAKVEGRPDPLPPLSVQYSDFARWQREWLQGEILDSQVAYWGRQLGDGPPALELPTDRPRPPVQTFRGTHHRWTFEPGLWDDLARLGAQAGSTRFMTLLSAFSTLLHRITGQEDFCVGTFIANRNRTETEGLIGFFVNNLALRVEPAHGLSFRQLLGRVRETTLAAYAHQDLPFEKLLAELKLERTLDRTPLFQVMCVLQNTPKPDLELPGLRVSVLPVEGRRANFDLTLWVEERPEAAASLEYNTDLFDAATMAGLASRLEILLRGAAAFPEARLSELPLLTSAERSQLVGDWNDTRRKLPGADLSVARLFEAQAERAPDATAVVCGGVSLTYGELMARTGLLAGRLAGMGAGPETLVGICLERSPDMVVALLAVLRAGAAYLPLDPGYPRERLAFLLADAPVTAVLTSERLRPLLPETAAAVLCLDGVQEAEPARWALPGGAHPESLAYLIYTSGSTGRPKAVMVRQGSLLNHTLSAMAAYGLGPGDRVLQFASINFDASAEEIYPTLLSGATLVLRDEAMLGTHARFLETCGAWGITVLDLPTAYWHDLVAGMEAEGLELPAPVRLVILGGEKAMADRLAQWRHSVGGRVQLVNTYGPTEATIVATRADLAGLATGEAPIGGPIDNVLAHLVDGALQLVPVGVPGELCLGGAGVARGYLGRPELTAERFVPDPFGGGPGARMYRTGDLAVRRPAGVLEFVGRSDDQVKVRGFRVELREVEVRLREHPGVREAIVLARQDRPGVNRLFAYIVPFAEPGPGTSELRAFLSERLPEYMLPTAFLVLSHLPLTRSGKVDKAALPRPDGTRPELARGYVAPRTFTEEILAGIWADVLGVQRVGAADDFFELGGYSLLATQIIARVREAFGVELALAAFFEVPTVARLAERIDRAGRQALPGIERVPRDRDLPLSFAQERIWFLAQLDPSSTSYHVPRALRLSGDLDVRTLERAYEALLGRHEILRTTFPAPAGRPVQRIHPPCPFTLAYVDLRGLPEELREAEVLCQVLRMGQALFDLENGPLIRAAVLHLGEGEYAALQTEHHLVHDGWAEVVLLHDLLSFYSAFREGREPELPELPIQFADFAAWQRRWLVGEALEEQLAYWRRQLAGAPKLLELPTDRPRPPVQTGRGAEQEMRFAPEFAESLHAMARRNGTTLFMVMMSTFQAVLHRYSGQSDLVVGTGIANRRYQETEGLLGMIINTLPLRTRLQEGWRFGELLNEVREVCLGAYAHQDIPFEKLVEALQPERSLSHAPIFQVMFAFHDVPRPHAEVQGLRVRPIDAHNRSSKFDMMIVIVPRRQADGRDGEVTVLWEYSTDLWDNTTIHRLVDHFTRALRSVAEDPGLALSRIPLMSEVERHQVLAEWNVTGRRWPVRGRCVHELFEARAARSPEAVAVLSGGERLVYGELDRRANRLARHLRGLGVGPESRVGLCLGRSAELVVALLGILKAGGAYVPLDPDYPQQRLAFTLADARVAVLLTEERLAGLLPDPGVPVVCLDRDAGVIGRAPELPLPPTADPENLAYILYTSGSTGRPKGVAVSHRSIINFLASMAERPGIAASDILLAVTSLSFDIAGLEIYLPLSMGATVVVAGREEAAEGRLLLDLLTRTGATVLQATPSTWRLLLEAGWEGDRCLMALCGGEALPRTLATELARRAGVAWNLYGPTETTIWSAVQELGPVDGPVSIGRPIANTQLYLLDPDFQPVPLGIPGELYIGGGGLARGYLGRPDLTAERFLPDPFSGLPGIRLYRTGDLVRHRADGCLEFLGRLDSQVKVRGFRIELGEIEAALGRHSGVKECAVVVREGLPGDPLLAAYIVPAEGGSAPDGEALREHLKAGLPHYMIPGIFVSLESMPLTPNGKVDRKALPAPRWARAAAAPAFSEPVTAVEQVLAAVWSEVLGAGRVGRDDSFFGLGGHSLLATQVASRLRAASGVELPLRALFESPRLADLARRIEVARRGASPDGKVPPLVPLPRDLDLPLSFGQERLWFLHRLAPASAVYNIPVGLRLSGRLDPAALRRALGEVIRRHEALRTTFALKAGEPIQRVAPAGAVALPVVDLRALPRAEAEAQLRRLASAEAARPFDLGRGPLLRAGLISLAADEHVLLASVHHIVSDDWSMGVLTREVVALYQACRRGEPSPLPDLPVQYGDFAAWQRRWLAGDVLEVHLAWWRERLAGAPPSLDLPLDRLRPAVQTHRGATRSRVLPEPLAEALPALGQRGGTTLFMTLLAAFDVLLFRHTGQDDLTVGFPIANRTRLELEPLIGLFVNTLALRASLAGDPAFTGLLARMREAILDAYAHQDLPFEKLVEALRPNRDLGRSPLFQVMFVLQNAPSAAIELPGLTVRPVEPAAATAKLDVTLTVIGTDRGLLTRWNYNRDLLDEATVERMAGHFETLLTGMLVAPEARLSELPLLGEEEQEQLRAWNATAAPYRVGACLHDLVGEQVERAPESLAVEYESESLTYGGLWDLSGALARRLRALGVGPEARVGVFAQRSLELPVGLLAVLRAGGAYVPLDPSYPSERLAFMAEDAGVTVLLSQERLLDRLPQHRAPVLVLEEAGREGAQRELAWMDDGHLAYVIYTSGSTGRPKGVMNTHRGIVNRLLWMQEAFGLQPEEGVLQKTPASFDVSVWELFWPLLTGARLVMARPGGHQDPEYLAEVIESARVTTIHFVPSMLRVFVDSGQASRCPGLRRVIASGEALPADLVERWHALGLPAKLHNLYGPTEAAVEVTHWPCEAVEGTVPIGRPVANTRMHVLDVFFQPVPVGVAGELCIGGVQVSRGYLGRPELTAERFVPDPFEGSGGARLYRTGDLGRRRVDGALEYMGRIDHQVKLRGFRIELGEIESLLGKHPAVRECAVAVRELAGDSRLTAYVVPVAGETGETLAAALRSHLRERLPEFMVPSAFIELPSLPLTPSGKLDRRALPAASAPRRLAGEPAGPRSDRELRVVEVWRELLGTDRVGVHDNLFDLGAHSLLIVRAHLRLRDLFGDRLTLIDLFRHPTIASLVEHLGAGLGELARPRRGRDRAEARRSALREAAATDIAIVGMSGRFPRARDLDRFWRNLREGVEAVSFFTDGELAARGVQPELLRDPAYVKAGAVLEDADLFDASFFGYSPREAELMDPQQRLFLECAWETIEDAGYDPRRLAGATGVFAGASMNWYWLNLYANLELWAAQGVYPAMISNDKDFLATRVSYKLDLTGPALTVQTACSTSLVAVHLACRSLIEGECDMALAGGASIKAQQGSGYLYTEGGIASPDGRCRAFDAGARGTVIGNGVGVVALKRLPDALTDGDAVRAVIKGTAINNDGADKVGYTAPSVEGQASVIAEALAVAGIDPATVSYIEAHGTGTELGDPIEVAALTEAFRARTGRNGFCALGSVKTAIGHLDAAAGVAGLLKAVLALQHREIPPSLHFEQPNPRIAFAGSPFYVNARLAPWPAAESPRRAGVSSFGMGGTNAHAVLEEAPPVQPSGTSRAAQLLVLSARSEAALEAATDNLVRRLRERPEVPLSDVAYTLLVGRGQFGFRRVVVARDGEDAARFLESRSLERVLTSAGEVRERPVAFLFPGQGVQHPRMGLNLYRTEQCYRRQVDRCCEMLQPLLGLDLRQVLHPADVDLAAAAERLAETALAQPALFVVEYALAQLWMEWGVRPEALIGHSVGEYVAACLAGVFSLEEGLALVAARGRLVQDLPRGAMLSVGLPEAELVPRLGEALALAAVNGPGRCVAAGPEEAVAELAERLAAEDIPCRRLHTSHAFHSWMLEPALEAFAAQVRRVRLAPPRLPLLSNVTGAWLTDAEAVDPDYWVRHLRQTVRFGDGLGELLRGERVLLEVGPGSTLCKLVRRHPEGVRSVVLATLPEPGGEECAEAPLETLGRIWLAGGGIDGAGLYIHERRHRVPLPTYPFERQRFWLDMRRDGAALLPRSATGRRAGLADWFYLPSWKPSTMPAPAPEALSRWLVLAGAGSFSEQVVDELRARGHDVVAKGEVEGLEAHGAMVRELLDSGGVPARFVDLRAAEPVARERSAERGFLGMLHLAQALARAGVSEPVALDFVSIQAHAVEAGDQVRPEGAAALGLVHVLPQEHSNLVCRNVDLAASDIADGRATAWLVGELLSGSRDLAVACRQGRRWVRSFEQVRVEAPAGHPGLRPGGVYLILGGLGQVGLALAEHLANAVQAKLVLTGRSSFPAREVWPAWLEAHAEDDPISLKVRRLMAMEQTGAEVLVLAADAADEAAMERIEARVREHFGVLHGAVHAAGFAGERIYRATTEIGRAELEEHFRPKVHAVRVLEKFLAGFEPDFCVLVSSLATVLGGLGLGAYAAAHRFLEAFAEERSRTSGFPWMALSLDGWSRSALKGEAGATLALGAQLLELSMTPREGAEVFCRALTLLGWPRVVVSTGDLGARMARWLRTEPAATERPAAGRVSLHVRPALHQPYVEPRDETERAVAEVWRGLLGIGEIGAHDGFFDLGGDSLLATQLASALRRSFRVDLPLRTLFDRPTVAGQAEVLGALLEGPGKGAGAVEEPFLAPIQRGASTLDQLRDLESLSEEEVRLLLVTDRLEHPPRQGAEQA